MAQLLQKRVVFREPMVLKRKRAQSVSRKPRLTRGYQNLAFLRETDWLDLRHALEEGKSTGKLVEVVPCTPEDTLPEHHGKIHAPGYKRLKVQ